MALLSRPHRREMAHEAPPASAVTEQPSSAMVEERRSAYSSDGRNAVLRALGALAGGLATVVGIVALIRIDWTDGLSSAPADVLGMGFTPSVAIATTVIGLIALAAGASADRASKLAIGAILVCLGVAIVVAGDNRADFDLEAGHGWFAVIVGGVLLLAGLLMHHEWVSRRQVRADGYPA
jgi:hypothetical protein